MAYPDARQLARKSLTADERCLINVEIDMLHTEWRKLKLMIALLERKRRVNAGMQIGETKTAASAKPVPLHPDVAHVLRDWQHVTEYKEDSNFLFPSIRNNGQVPVWPDTLLQKVIRPAAERAGIRGKTIGWHTFRHSLGTNLRSLGVDIKVAQELLRHANAKITLDLYRQAISSQKREANARVVEMLLPSGGNGPKSQHHLAPSARLDSNQRPLPCQSGNINRINNLQPVPELPRTCKYL